MRIIRDRLDRAHALSATTDVRHDHAGLSARRHAAHSDRYHAVPISSFRSMVGVCLMLSLGTRVHGRGDYESHRSRRPLWKRRLVLRLPAAHPDIWGRRLFLTIIRQRLTFQS
jgi:hypothetical protein